jgi:eukaryotic-like serine/threonine-protein kinase
VALNSGTRLGPYEISAPIGAGGMGEVYKATDTRLERTVAIKVLPEHVAIDANLKRRFEREAKTLAALSHSHICPVFDVGSQNGVDFLVMEYLEGETLEQRLKQGALPVDQAQQIAIQIADALTAAHRSGIIHRDLKPGNVMLTKSGAKLLDFGLAKTGTPAAAGGLSMLPTTPPGLTQQGTILGTFQYMAPEQLEGHEADARTDIFAFGAVLYETFTGKKAFEGKSQASLIGAILKDDPPPVSRVQPLAPAALDRIICTCLAKDPDDRYQSTRDLLRDLKWVSSGSTDGATVQPAVRPPRSNRVPWLVAAAATLALIVTAAIALRLTADSAGGIGAVQFTIAAPEDTSFGGPSAGGTGTATQLAVSPDGRNIVFVAGAQLAYQLWLRPVAAQAATPIPGTEGGTFPFWSPDSRFIGFFADDKLKKVAIAGGPPIVLCDAPFGRGGTWSRDNVILFSPSSLAGTGLMRVSSAGGVPVVVTTVDPASETNHRWPHFLPDGRHFIYTASTGACCPAETPSAIRIGSLEPAEAELTLLQPESSVSYASGHVLFARDDTLIAQPFDPDSRRLTGDDFPLAEHVGPEGSRYISVSASANGTLVYAQDGSQAPRQLMWFDRTGRALGTLGDAAQYSNPALSADEKRVALALTTGNPGSQDIWRNNLRSDIWIIDIARNLRSRLTVDPGMDRSPVWSPDGTRIVFVGERSLKVSLRQKLVDGTAADETLLEGSDNITPTDWSDDGRFIAYTLSGAFPQRNDIWVLPLFGDRKPFPLVQTAFLENSAVFSPDGRWIAYMSNEAGRPNVYVQPFPEGGARHQVSRDGGGQPVWRSDGKELFFIGPDGTMMAAPINATGQFDAGVPRALFPAIHPSALTLGTLQYSVTTDGNRFLINVRPQKSGVTPITVVVNWTAATQK